MAFRQSNLHFCNTAQRTAIMRAATRVFSAIFILAGFFLIKTYLYHLPIAEAFHGSDIMSLADVGQDASTKVNETIELPSSSALDDGHVQATATAQNQASATEIETTSTSSSIFLDQIVVMGKTNSEDTSWVEKLPTSVFSAAWSFTCDES